MTNFNVVKAVTKQKINNFQGDITNEGEKIMQFKLTWGGKGNYTQNKFGLILLHYVIGEGKLVRNMIFSNFQFS